MQPCWALVLGELSPPKTPFHSQLALFVGFEARIILLYYPLLVQGLTIHRDISSYSSFFFFDRNHFNRPFTKTNNKYHSKQQNTIKLQLISGTKQPFYHYALNHLTNTFLAPILGHNIVLCSEE